MGNTCVNIESKEFKDLLEKSNINTHVLAAKVSLWQDNNGLDKFPSVQDLSNKFYQLTNTQKKFLGDVIPELDKHLINYLKPFGVKTKEFNELKSRLGIDALGTTDIINKLIWYSKDRNVETVPEEFGHMITHLMGESNPIIKDLLANISEWSEFQDIKTQYDPIYKNDKQVRIEAVGKLIAKALVKNYKAHGTDSTLLEKALKAINEFIAKLLSGLNIKMEDVFDYPTKLADKIAIKVLSGHTNIIDNENSLPKLDYQKAIDESPFAKSLINKFTSGEYKDFKLTGSLAISKQGNIHRSDSEKIHDLDFIGYGNDSDLEKLIEDVESMGGIPRSTGIVNDNYVTYSFIIPHNKSEKITPVSKSRGWIFDYKVGDKKGDTGNSTSVDFFWYKNKPNENSFENVASFNDVFNGKIGISNMGERERMFQRFKDQKDFVLFRPSYIGKSDPKFLYYQLGEKQPDFKTVYDNLFGNRKTFSSPEDGIIEINPGAKANTNRQAIAIAQERISAIKKAYPNLSAYYDQLSPYDPIRIHITGLGKNTVLRNQYFPTETRQSKDILGDIGKSEHPLAPLANQLLNYSDTFNVPVNLVSVDKNTEELSAEHEVAWYDTGAKQIFVNENGMFKGLGVEPTLIHEILHSYTQGFIDNNPEHPVIRDLQKAFDIINQNKDKIKDKYGLTNLHEFVSEFFTNGQFVSDLMKLDPTNKFNSYKNLFQQILDHILSLFRTPVRQRSLYEEVFPLMTNVIDEAGKDNRIDDDFARGNFFLDSYDNIIADNDNIDKAFPTDNFDDLIDTRDQINEEYSNVYASLLRDYDDPTKIKLNVLDRETLPDDFARAVEGKLETTEISQIAMENIAKRLQMVLPEINITTIDQSELNQDEHLLPIQDIHSFIKGNTVYLVNGRFDSEDKMEEFLHPFTLGLQRQNEELFNNIFNENKDKYEKEYGYYSRIDESAAKNEVVTKAIKDALVNEEQRKGWFTKFMDFVKDILRRIFPLSKNHQLLTKDLDTNLTVNDLATLLNNGGYKFEGYYTDNPFYSANPQQRNNEENANKLFNFAENNGIKKIGTDGGYIYKSNPLKRVSSIVDKIVKSFFPGREFTKEQIADNDRFKKNGTKLHAIIEDVIGRYVDPNSHMVIPKTEGDIKNKNLNGFTAEVYNSIEKYITDVLYSYEKGTRFLSETVLGDLEKQVSLTKEEQAANTANKGLMGTVDFIALKNDGKYHVLDFKFLHSYGQETVAASKKAGYNTQFENYVSFIRNITGARKEDIEKAQIIPFLVKEKNGVVANVITPSLDLSEIENPRSLPFITNSQYIPVKELRVALDKLNNIPVIEHALRSELDGKGQYQDNKLVNEIADATSKLLLADDNFDGNIGKLLDFHEHQLGEAEGYIKIIKDATANPIDDLSNYTKFFHIESYVNGLIEATSNMNAAARFVYGDDYEKEINKTPEEEELKARIERFETSLKKLKISFERAQEALAQSFGRFNKIDNIMQEEKKVTGFQKLFTFMSSPRTRTVAVLRSVLRDVYPKLERIITSGYQRIASMRNNSLQMAAKRGQSIKDVNDSFIDFSGKIPKLKSKIDKSFYTDRDKLLEEGSLKKLKEFYGKYYRLDEYKTIAAKKLQSKIDEINSTISSKKVREKNIEREKERYDLEKPSAYKNISSYYQDDNDEFKNKYYTEFGKNLLKPENIDKKEFHDLMIKYNRLLKSEGLIPPGQKINVNTFIPFIHKGLTDKLSEGDFKSIKKTWLEQWRVSSNSGLYGYVDPLTEQEENRIFVPFTQDQFHGDYSRMSTDLYKIYSMFQEGLEKAVAMKKIAPIAEALLRIEQGKKVLPVTSYGKIKKAIGIKDQNINSVRDDANVNYFKQFRDAIIYGRKIQDSTDYRWKSKDGDEYSLARMLETGMGFMYGVTFGFNVMTPLRSLVSALVSTGFMKGEDFRGRELLGFDSFWKGLTTTTGKMDNNITHFAALMGYFLPYNNPQHERRANRLSVNSLTKWAHMENSMQLMEKSDRWAQAMGFYAILKNTVIIDGEFVNAKRLVGQRHQDYYDSITEGGKWDPAKAKQLDSQIEKEIEDLIKDKGILTHSRVENGQLIIDGLDSSEEGLKKEEKSRNALTILAQNYAQKATGMMSHYDFIGYKTSMFGRATGQYRSWIPRTTQARMGAFKYNVDTEGYEWGRWRSYVNAIGSAWKESFLKMGSTLLGFTRKEALVKYAKERYNSVKEEMEANGTLFTGQFISEKDFIDRYLADVNNTVNEFRVITGLFVGLLSALLAPKPDDDDEVKNAKSWARYQLNRGLQEFTFYVNPMSFAGLFNNALPIISSFNNIYRLGYNSLEQLLGFIFSDKLEDKAHPMKYLFRAAPISSEVLKWLPLIDASYAKELGVKPVSVNFSNTN